MPVPAAAAGIHGAHEHEAARQRDAARGAGDGHLAVLERRAEGFKHIAVELGKLVQKQHAVVGEGNLTGGERPAAAGHGCGGKRVMRRAERALREHGVLAVGQSRDRPDLGGLQRLLVRHVGENGGQTPREHGLARTGRADEKHVVGACGGDLQRALDVLLPHDVGKIGNAVRLDRRLPALRGGKPLLAAQMAQKLRRVFHAVDGQTVGQRRLGGVRRGDIKSLHARTRRGHRHRQHTADGAQRAGERQLTDERGGRVRRVDLTLAREDTEQQRKVVDRAFFLQVRGREVDRDAADGELRSAVFDRRADTLARLLHRRVAEADHVERGKPAREEALHRDLITGNALQTEGTHRCDHTLPSFPCLFSYFQFTTVCRIRQARRGAQRGKE